MGREAVDVSAQLTAYGRGLLAIGVPPDTVAKLVAEETVAEDERQCRAEGKPYRAPEGAVNEAIATLDHAGRPDLGSVVKALWRAT